MRKRLVGLSLGLGLLVVMGLVTIAAQTSAPAAGADKGEAQIDLVLTLPKITSPDGARSTSARLADVIASIGTQQAFVVDSFFDVSYVRNIGSSGQDGVRASSYQIDSFFDIEYEIFGDPDFDIIAISVRGTLADPSNPALATDAINKAVLAAGGDVYVGHVTVLK